MLVFVSLAIGCLFLIAHSQPLNADDERRTAASSTPEELGKYLLERMQTSRVKLKSGVFEAHRVVNSKTSEKDQQQEAKPIARTKIFCAFDFENDLLRFDKDERWFDTESSAEKVKMEQVSRYFTTRTEARRYSSQRHEGQEAALNQLQEVPPCYQLQRRRGAFPIFFDVRLVGICTKAELVTVAGSEFEGVVKFYTEKCSATGKPLDDNQYLLILSQDVGESQVRREFVLDASRDFVPVQYDQRYRNPDSDEWKSLFPPITAEWKKSEQSDVYVPVKLKFPDKKADDELTFEWKSVNQPPDQKLFTEESLNVPPGTHVVDATIPGKPVPARRKPRVNPDTKPPAREESKQR